MNPRRDHDGGWWASGAGWGAGLLALWLAVAPAAAAAEPAEPSQEALLKVALIYNFSQFIEWPASAFSAPSAPLSICVMGSDPFGNSLAALSKRSSNGRPIAIAYPQTLAEARLCQILYVDGAQRTALGRDLGNALGAAPVLTISSSDASEAGIAIRFVHYAGKIRWTMNLDATRRARLKVSAKLIEIAVEVLGESK